MTAKAHDLTPAAELLHGDQEVVYGHAGYQGIAKRPEMAGTAAEFRLVIRPGKVRAWPDTSEERLQDLIEAAKTHVRAKVEQPFRVIFAKPAGGRSSSLAFRKIRLGGLAKNRCKVNVLTALTNLFLARRLLL